MKRHNRETQKPFKRGDTRIDGKVFRGYTNQINKSTGYFTEIWVSKILLENRRHKDRKNKQIQRAKNPNRLPYGSAHLFKNNKRAVLWYKKLAQTPPNQIDWEWGVPPDLSWLKKYFTS